MTTSKLDEPVWLIEDNKIVETTPRECGGYIEEMATPHGVAPVYHVEGKELRRWRVDGRSVVVTTFDSEAEAQEALEETFINDFWNCASITAFATRGAAEDFLKESQS